jgi:hypothetical protein
MATTWGCGCGYANLPTGRCLRCGRGARKALGLRRRRRARRVPVRAVLCSPSAIAVLLASVGALGAAAYGAAQAGVDTGLSTTVALVAGVLLVPAWWRDECALRER